MKPASPSVLPATRLLDPVSVSEFVTNTISLRTEQAYVQWVRMFVKWRGLRHPRNMGPQEIEGFLAIMAE